MRLRNEAEKVGADEAAAGSILVWNGLVARMRRIGVDGRRVRLAWTSSAHSSEDESPTRSRPGATPTSS